MVGMIVWLPKAVGRKLTPTLLKPNVSLARPQIRKSSGEILILSSHQLQPPTKYLVLAATETIKQNYR